MLFEPMNRTVASDKIETSWHVGRGSCHLYPRAQLQREKTHLQQLTQPPPARVPNANHQTQISPDLETGETT
jgi:hypothetical protein